ncbi:MAG: FxsA family protein [Alphaproteobacteria bacterium]|nr:MAG: FxsA family protein [Alphaproteobacteria bacterium]
MTLTWRGSFWSQKGYPSILRIALPSLQGKGPDIAMGMILFLLFLGIPLIEIGLFVEVGGAIGLGPTLLVVIGTAVMGSWLLRAQGLATYRQAQKDMSDGMLPVDQVVHGLFLVVAGVLLLTPGFLTDTLGFLLFVPPIRLALGRSILKYIARHGEVQVKTYRSRRDSTDSQTTIIEGEIIDPNDPR